MTHQDFMELPTQRAWRKELTSGRWDGPDGSSMSTDHINGVRIGKTSIDWAFRTLPANLHDWRYHLGRTHGLGSSYRLLADVAFREDCIRTVAETLDGRMSIALAVIRSWGRYYVLRLFGWKAFGQSLT